MFYMYYGFHPPNNAITYVHFVGKEAKAQINLC